MASEPPKKKIVDKKKKIAAHAKKKLEKEKEKEKELKEKPEPIKEKPEDKETDSPKLPPSNIIDGRVFEADRELAMSQEEEEAMIKFKQDLEKYHKISRQEREETLKEEKKQLLDQEKSPKMKYYDGSKADRLRNVDLEIEILEQMEKLSTSKQDDD